VKKYSKIIALLTVAVLVLGFAGIASAADFSDIADSAAKSDIVKLNALGVINGYEDGTFKPDGNITRAEFAKIAVVAAGLGSSADLLKDATPAFSDVKTGAWYTGWINLAASQGYVKGYPNGTFKPAATISNSEVVTVLLRILGYNDNLAGSWPVDYIVKAADLDITEDVAFSAKAAAKRGDVAVMAAATLDATIVEWDNDKEKFEEQTMVEGSNTVEVSLLEDKFEGSITKDKVVLGWKYDGDEFQVVTDSGSVVVNGDAKFSGAATVAALDDHVIDYIVNDDDEIVFAEVQDYGFFVDDAATLDINSDGDYTDIDIDDENYDFADSYYANVTSLVSPTDDTEFTADVIKVALNDDGDVVRLEVAIYPVPAIVKEVRSDDRIVVKETGDTTVPSDLDEDDVDYILFRDGKIVDVSELEENDLLYNFGSGLGVDYYLRAYSVARQASGELEASYDNGAKIKIDGVKYDVAANAWVSKNGGEDFDSFDLAKFYGEEVTAVFNIAGDVQLVISEVEGSAGSTIYGVVSDVDYKLTGDTDSSGNQITEADQVTVLLSNGKEVTYDVNSDSDDAALAADEGDYVEFDLADDGAIDYWFDRGIGAVDITDVDTDRDRIQIDNNSWYFLDSDSVIFNANGTDDAEVVSVNDLVDYIDGGNTPTVDFEADGNEIDYLWMNATVSSSTDYAMVLDKGVNSDGEYLFVDIAGTTSEINAKDNNVDLDAAEEGVLISFEKSGDDLASIDKLTTSVTSEVYDVDADRNAIDIAGTQYIIDEDTVIYDITGDDPVYIELDEVFDGDFVEFGKEADTSVNMLDWIVVSD